METELDQKLKEYHAEMTLTEKYQAFSMELLRLSFLGIAILGFFVDKIATLTVFASENRIWMLVAMGVAAFLFSLAAAAALASRYYSTEALYHRLQILKNQPDPTGQQAEIRDRLRMFLFYTKLFTKPESTHVSMMKSASEIAGCSNGVSASFAAIASFFVIITFFIAIFGYTPNEQKLCKCRRINEVQSIVRV
jgi:hypothetical protein